MSVIRFSRKAWNDGTSDVVTVDFDFTAYSSQIAAVNVDSATQDLTLTDYSISGSSVSVAVTRPSTCTIGKSDVLDANVFFMDGSSEVTTDTNITFTEGSSKSIGIRFSAVGNHGDDSGSVSCAGNGLLRYTF